MLTFLDQAVDTQKLTGGEIHAVWLATQPDGQRFVVKISSDAPAGLFAAEAQGLEAIRGCGAIRTPDVIQFGDDHLVLEALEARPLPYDDAFSEQLGRELAQMHSLPVKEFGWPIDNWLGLFPQVNTYTDDGYEFFATHRLRCFLSSPRVTARLDPAVLAGIERICDRLPLLLPPMPPVLTHGDLWHANVVATVDHQPVLIDPAVSWTWAAVDISTMVASGMPARILDAYHEILPPEPDWREHARLLHLRMLLSEIAHNTSWADNAVIEIGDLVRHFA